MDNKVSFSAYSISYQKPKRGQIYQKTNNRGDKTLWILVCVRNSWSLVSLTSGDCWASKDSPDEAIQDGKFGKFTLYKGNLKIETNQ